MGTRINPWPGYKYICRALAVTPRQSKDMDFSDVTAICYDYTINGLNNMAAHVSKLFRFIYVSGVTVERDQKKTLPFMSEYRLMRVRVLCSFLPSSIVLSYTCAATCLE